MFSRAREDNTWLKVHTTETVMNNLNPSFQPFKINMVNLCNLDPLKPIQIACFDYDSSGEHELIGKAETSTQEMLSKVQDLHLKNPKKAAEKSSYKNSGTFSVVSSAVVHEPSFLEFIEGGCNISFMVAIDYTGSNGNQTNPKSLHYLSPNSPNEYERAIIACGEILENYDTDKNFPV